MVGPLTLIYNTYKLAYSNVMLGCPVSKPLERANDFIIKQTLKPILKTNTKFPIEEQGREMINSCSMPACLYF